MKVPRIGTLAWIAAVVAALLFALAVPEAYHAPHFTPEWAHGAGAPR